MNRVQMNQMMMMVIYVQINQFQMSQVILIPVQTNQVFMNQVFESGLSELCSDESDTNESYL